MTPPVLMTTIDLLDAVRLRCKSMNLPDSDYQAAKQLGVTHGAVSQWRNRKTGMSEDAGLAAANFLQIEPEYVIACILMERAKTDETRTFWRQLAERIAARSSVATVAFLAVFTASAWLLQHTA